MSPFLDYAGSPASSSDSKAADDAGVEINHLPTNAAEPIAITGLSFKFPQDATSYETFWEMLSQGRNAMTDFPNSRLNLHAFHHPDPNRMDTVSDFDFLAACTALHTYLLQKLTVRGGHFLKEDVAFFDAPFFSITANEAESMDPQQRGLLEAAYLALENGTRASHSG
jgi:acyl transferase domain-containing protein